MARLFTRKLIDTKGNQWCLSIPADVNPESLEEIMIGAREGIVKLLGYRLEGDAFYKLPADNSEIVGGNKTFSFYKKVEVVGVDQKDFAEVMQHLLTEARKSKIGKARVTTFEGKPIEKDERGFFIKWDVPCHMCEKPIVGVRRLSMSDGQFTRAQAFVAFDKGAISYRPGSKYRVCGACAPKHLTPEEAGINAPTVEEVKQEIYQAEVVKEEIKAKIPKEKDPLQELMDLVDPKSTVDPLFVKGAMYWYLKSQKK